MYYCIPVLWTTAAAVILSVSFIGTLVLTSVLENSLAKAAFLIGAVIAFLLLMYIFFHRGIAVYSRGKIRIFKFVIRTYKTDRIDDIRLDYTPKKCTVHITVQGDTHTFTLSPSSALRFEERIRSVCTPKHRS